MKTTVLPQPLAGSLPSEDTLVYILKRWRGIKKQKRRQKINAKIPLGFCVSLCFKLRSCKSHLNPEVVWLPFTRAI